MDGPRFDTLARSLASGASRRTLLKGLFAGAAGAIAVSRPAGAQLCTTDEDCDGTWQCCPAGGCIVESEVCCGTGFCPAGDVCCGNVNCCPTAGYICSGIECCETCDRRQGQCGEVQIFCGNTPTIVTCAPRAARSAVRAWSSRGTAAKPVTATSSPQGPVARSCASTTSARRRDASRVMNVAPATAATKTGTAAIRPARTPPCEADGCKSNKDCKDDECCCHDGGCSHNCCSDDGDNDNGVSVGGVPVERLPNTGTGVSSDAFLTAGTAAMLGSAAALAGARLIRDSDRQELQN